MYIIIREYLQGPPVNAMSINDKNYGRGKIVMLALMMVTSTFAAIGTTAADPSGMEHVYWHAENGEMYMHEESGTHIYEYDTPWDAVYDFKFYSDGLDLDDTYKLQIVLVDMDMQIDVYENWFEWTAYDNDGDGYADNSSEFLVNGADVDVIANNTCYDAVAMLHAQDGAGNYNEIASIGHLIGFGEYDCHQDWEVYEHLTMEFRDAHYDTPQPHYDDYSDADVLLIPSGLHESGSWCENMTTGEDEDLDQNDCEAGSDNIWIEETVAYHVYYSLWNWEYADPMVGIFMDVTEGDELQVEITENGCYDLDAQLNINATVNADGMTHYFEDYVAHVFEGFSVGDVDCGGHSDPVHPWSKAGIEFNPEMGVFGYYGVEEPIDIHYGAWNLEPLTTYTSVIHILGPFMPNGDDNDNHHDDNHHDAPSFICGNGEEIPFEYVNDGDQDCEDGADEQQFDADGNKINWFDCHDGSQIWIDQVNDGIDDCPHGEDEGHHEEHGGTHGHQAVSDDDGVDNDCDGSVDEDCDDNHDQHDDEESEYCYDMENHDVEPIDNQEDCEAAGFMWVKEDAEAHPEPIYVEMINMTSDDMGEFSGTFTIPGMVLMPGFYGVMHMLMDADGELHHQMDEPEMFCVSEEVCTPPNMDPWEHTTGHGYYQMHFDQFETFVDDESGESFNGVLEISSIEHMDASYRMFADANEDGMVDPMEALMFLEMMSEGMNDDHHMDDECSFDMDHPDSPCNVEACQHHNDDANDDACWDAVMTYCENNPEDEGCEEMDDMEQCPFDMDHPDSPCNYEACDPMSDEHNESACHSKVEAYCADNPEDEGCHMDDEENHDEHDHGDHEDDGTHGNSADGRHCVPEGEVCPEDGGDDHDHDDHGDHDDDDTFTIALDGTVLGEPNHEWMWIDGLVGPVDGSDGMSVSIMSGSVWLLSLEDWETAEQHVVSLYESDNSALVEECIDGVRENDPETGLFAVYDSWAWSPVSVEAEGEGWIPEANEEHGWTLPFDCDSGELNALSVVFSKTVKDYNADNLDREDIEPGPEADWEVDVEDNQAPTCHVFASVSNGTDWEEGEEHFEAPNGDHTIELMAGMWYLSIYCKDPDGDMVMGQVTFTDVTYEFLEEGEGHAYTEFMAIEGMPNVTFDYKWDSTGGHSGAGSITLVVLAPENNVDDIVEPTTNDDGTLSCPDNLVLSDDQTQCVAPSVDNVGDIIEEVAADEGGSIPGFTSTLSVISMLGAVLVMSRRKQDC